MLAVTHYVQFDVELLARLQGFVIPVLVALITRARASQKVKALTNLVLSAVAASVAVAVAQHGQVDLQAWLSSFLWTVVTSFASYYGLWKPTGVAPVVGQATNKFGIGQEVQDSPAPFSNSPTTGQSDSLNRTVRLVDAESKTIGYGTQLPNSDVLIVELYREIPVTASTQTVESVKRASGRKPSTRRIRKPAIGEA